MPRVILQLHPTACGKKLEHVICWSRPSSGYESAAGNSKVLCNKASREDPARQLAQESHGKLDQGGSGILPLVREPLEAALTFTAISLLGQSLRDFAAALAIVAVTLTRLHAARYRLTFKRDDEDLRVQLFAYERGWRRWRAEDEKTG